MQKVLLDTCALIWLATGDARLSRSARRIIFPRMVSRPWVDGLPRFFVFASKPTVDASSFAFG